MPDKPRIDLYDTTLRDGSQGEGVHFSLDDKLAITERLDRLGIDFIEGGYPLSNPKDAEYFRAVRDLDLKHAQVAAFGMTRRRGVKAADDVGMNALLGSEAPVVTIVGKTWDLHVRDVLGVDEDENLAMIADSVGHCARAGRRVFYDAEHFFDGLRDNRDFALSTLRAAVDAGAECVILCDTNGGSLPGWIGEAVGLVRGELSCTLGIHCHNDGDLATANTLAAVAAAATHVQGTVNGIGERCGNADLVAIAANLSLKLGHPLLTGGSVAHLTEVSRFVYDTAGMNFRNGQPFVGRSAFAHKGGMHVHAVNKIPHSYEHIDPAAVGNERKILVSELAGRSNILAQSGHDLDAEQVKAVLGRVQDLEHQGYQFDAATGSFDLLVRKVVGSYEPFFEMLSHRVNIETHPSRDAGQDEPVTEATVKIRVGEHVEHTVAEGDGPVNALDRAVRKSLEPFFPALRELRLVDYKVRVVNDTAATAARVRVTVTSRAGGRTWGTVGVHENIVEASWLALRDAIEYLLCRSEKCG